MKNVHVASVIITGIHQPVLSVAIRYFLIAARDLSNIIMN
jgi:hypothetical protein